ncbi:MAG: hypothetical protein WC076_09520 [Terrimicrobiaceae bacterium]
MAITPMLRSVTPRAECHVHSLAELNVAFSRWVARISTTCAPTVPPT